MAQILATTNSRPVVAAIDARLDMFGATWEGSTIERAAWNVENLADVMPTLRKLSAEYGIDFLV